MEKIKIINKNIKIKGEENDINKVKNLDLSPIYSKFCEFFAPVKKPDIRIKILYSINEVGIVSNNKIFCNWMVNS